MSITAVIPARKSDKMRAPEAEREAYFAVLDEIRAGNTDKDPDEEFEYITTVVEAVRQEQYDREQATHGSP